MNYTSLLRSLALGGMALIHPITVHQRRVSAGHLMRCVAGFLAAVAIALPPSAASAAGNFNCPPGQPIPTQFSMGFAALKAQLGDLMGNPAECEHADPNGSGDTLQHTTAHFALAYWRKSTNTPIFFDGSTHYALTGAGLITWTGWSIDPPDTASAAQPPAPVPAPQPAQPAAPTPPAPPAAPPAPAAPLTSRSNPVVILVQGFASNSGEDYMPTLRADLAQQGVPDAHVFRFSYAGGDWSGNTWTPRPYSATDTEQSIDRSAATLADLVRGIRAVGPDLPISVVGFSLGGLVAVDQLATAVAANDRTAQPDRVLTISSPLNGLSVDAKCRAGNRVRNSFVAGGLVGAFLGGPVLADIAAGGIGLYIASFCPADPLGNQLAAIANNTGWRGWREAQISRALQSGVQVGTMHNTVDCAYYLALCSQDFGGDDVDDRSTTMLPVTTFQQTYREADHGWWWHVRASHGDILNDADAMTRAAGFAAGH